MSEQMAEQPAHDEASTGEDPVVGDVLASLDGLEERPVTEHVAVFERAHEALRSALDGPSA